MNYHNEIELQGKKCNQGSIPHNIKQAITNASPIQLGEAIPYSYTMDRYEPSNKPKAQPSN